MAKATGASKVSPNPDFPYDMDALARESGRTIAEITLWFRWLEANGYIVPRFGVHGSGIKFWYPRRVLYGIAWQWGRENRHPRELPHRAGKPQVDRRRPVDRNVGAEFEDIPPPGWVAANVSSTVTAETDQDATVVVPPVTSGLRTSRDYAEQYGSSEASIRLVLNGARILPQAEVGLRYYYGDDADRCLEAYYRNRTRRRRPSLATDDLINWVLGPDGVYRRASTNTSDPRSPVRPPTTQ